MEKDEFCNAVGKQVKEQWGHDDGDDLCWNLIDTGEIRIEHGVEIAAQVVAQHLEQA